MKTNRVDVAVIGTGTAGMNAYRAAKKHTDSIALIESGPYGTTCARVGCMPSKLLIAAAESAHVAQEAHVFGIHLTGPLRVDGGQVMRRVQSERDRFVGFVTDDVANFDARHKIRGRARFTGPNRIRVNDEIEIEARSIVIATGSTPFIPSTFESVSEFVDTNESVFEWPKLPESVAVFGPGVIGLELGQSLHRLGVRTTVFGRSARVGPLTHPEMQAQVQSVLGQELNLQLETKVVSASVQNGRALVSYLTKEGALKEASFDRLLISSGRRPQLTDLGLETTGLTFDTNGVPHHNPRTMQCGSSSIFIAGDAMNEHMLLHEASDTGRIAGRNAAMYPHIEPGHRRTPLQIAFTDPQIAMVGPSFQDLNQPLIGRVSFVGQGRSRVMAKNKGALFVFGEPGGRFLGAEMLGPSAEHIGHLLAWSLQQGLSVEEMLDMPFYHPVVEEGLRTALRDLDRQIKIS
ncbi:MAG: dihydrolipoyl dehydrogenase [Acidobacteria bacterium]|nr:dihydrolipoyl dehydrogenase [Acidobacteriota bacterium]